MNTQSAPKVHKSIFFSSILIFAFLSQAHAAIEYSGTSFNLVGPDGKVTAQLSSSAEGTPSLFFFDENNVVRLNLGIYPGGNPGIVLMDKNGKSAAVVTLMDDGVTPSISLRKDGEERKVLGIEMNDSAESKLGERTAPAEVITTKLETDAERRKEYLLYALAFFFGVIGAYVGGRLAVRKDDRVAKAIALASLQRKDNEPS